MGMIQPIRLPGDQTSEHEFSETRFLSKSMNHDERFEMSCLLWELILDRARQDLVSENPSLRCDAYLWLVSSRSELYTTLAPRYGLSIRPSDFRGDILAAGLPDYPDHGVPYLEVDTSDPDCWAYSHEEEPVPAYIARMADMLTRKHRVEEIESAICCGLELLCTGRKGVFALAAIKALLSCLTNNMHLKTTKRAILDICSADSVAGAG